MKLQKMNFRNKWLKVGPFVASIAKNVVYNSVINDCLKKHLPHDCINKVVYSSISQDKVDENFTLHHCVEKITIFVVDPVKNECSQN